MRVSSGYVVTGELTISYESTDGGTKSEIYQRSLTATGNWIVFGNVNFIDDGDSARLLIDALRES